MKKFNSPLSKLAAVSQKQGASERRTGAYTNVHADSSTEATPLLASAVAFRKRPNHEQGISLLEIMMVIAVSAVVLIIAVNYYSNVHLTSKVNLTIVQIRALYKGALSYYSVGRYQALNSSTSSPVCPLANNISAAGLACTLYQGGYIGQTDLISSWGKNAANSVTLTTGSTNDILVINLPAPVPVQVCNIINERLSKDFTSNFTPDECKNPTTSGIKLTFQLQ